MELKLKGLKVAYADRVGAETFSCLAQTIPGARRRVSRLLLPEERSQEPNDELQPCECDFRRTNDQGR
jgi:hypothetical protein